MTSTRSLPADPALLADQQPAPRRGRHLLLRALDAVNLPRIVYARLLLSRAKHPSLRGHPRMARRLARLVRYYDLDDRGWFVADGAPAAIGAQRAAAFAALAGQLRRAAPITLAQSGLLAERIADAEFTRAHRVPFQFRRRVMADLPSGCLLRAASGIEVEDLDGNRLLDVTGSYGVNLFGVDFYKDCIAAGVETARGLGPVLGSYHPCMLEVTERLRTLSGHEQVSFHMSGTEAVMQAVRLARYHTGRRKVVRFCGAYHGWWDGVQAGPGNPLPPHQVLTLQDLSPTALRALELRRDVACVLVNPLQALHPNGNAPADSMLAGGTRSAAYDRAAYTRWLQQLRELCDRCGIALIFDEVFLGFRLAPGGAQDYFGVRADLVTYGKTLGGGLPIGVVCGPRRWMRRYRPECPPDICFARGTFNSHPYVIAAMAEFLRRLDTDEVRRTYDDLDRRWDERAAQLNAHLREAGVPVRVANMTSVWTVLYEQPGRYHWLFQYYLRAAGIALSWVGTGRLIFAHHWTDDDFARFAERFVAAAQRMRQDGWWWSGPQNTGRRLRRRLIRELIAAAVARRASDR